MSVEAIINPADLDRTLLERYRAHGDQEAFAEIVRRYASTVFSASMRILGEPARADDVSQETFFRLSQRPDAVKHSLGGWLHTAATRLAIDALRSDTSRARREANHKPMPASDCVQWAEISPHVDQALSELPEEARALLVRHFLQNVSQAALAGEMRMSPATISRKIRSAVDLLRTHLKRRGICVAAAMLMSLMREHGAQAAPAALLRELGKITMLSGGKPAEVTASAKFSCGFWWVMSVAILALTFAGLICLIRFISSTPAPPGPAVEVVPQVRTVPSASP